MRCRSLVVSTNVLSCTAESSTKCINRERREQKQSRLYRHLLPAVSEKRVKAKCDCRVQEMGEKFEMRKTKSETTNETSHLREEGRTKEGE